MTLLVVVVVVPLEVVEELLLEVELLLLEVLPLLLVALATIELDKVVDLVRIARGEISVVAVTRQLPQKFPAISILKSDYQVTQLQWRLKIRKYTIAAKAS